MDFEKLKEINKNLKTIDIKGKDYVEVNKRVLAFRELYPNGTIETNLISVVDGTVLIKAMVRDENEKILATGLAYERENSSFINKTSYVENCETSAVGRALGFLGIGIDGSIASAEEVANAQKEQEKIKMENEKLKVMILMRKKKLEQDKSEAEKTFIKEILKKNNISDEKLGNLSVEEFTKLEEYIKKEIEKQKKQKEV